jgi:hypothetical protein
MTRARRAGGPTARAPRRAGLALAALALAAGLAAGCSGEDPGGVATAGRDDGAAGTAPPAKSPLEHEREFIACMRGEGIDMTDPIPGDTSGRSAVKYELDVRGQGSNPEFQAALDTCVHLLPPLPPEEPPTAEEQAAGREFAACMRANGVPDYPDPEAGEGQWAVFSDRRDPRMRKALATCAPLLRDPGPAGSGTPAPPPGSPE